MPADTQGKASNQPRQNWKALLIRFRPSTVSLEPSAALSTAKRPLERLPGWSNTGFLELHICNNSDTSGDRSLSASDPVSEHGIVDKLDATMKIVNVNGREHLANLKRTRGGVGSSASDEKQKRLESFFKKAKLGTTSKQSLPADGKDNKPVPVSGGKSTGKCFPTAFLTSSMMTSNFTQTCSETPCGSKNCTNCCLTVVPILLLSPRSCRISQLTVIQSPRLESAVPRYRWPFTHFTALWYVMATASHESTMLCFV